MGPDFEANLWQKSGPFFFCGQLAMSTALRPQALRIVGYTAGTAHVRSEGDDEDDPFRQG